MTGPPRHPTANAVLGFPPDERLLIVNADDFGMSEAVNAGVADAIDSGVASSCSLMVPCPAAPEAMRWLAGRPGVPFGVHLTLVCDRGPVRWGPVTPRALVPSLLDDDGEFFTPDDVPALLARARTGDAAREFRAQLTAVLDAGLAPTHLDWHCLADGGRADLFDVTLALAEEFGLAVRVWLEPARRALRPRGLPVTDGPFLDSFALPLDDRAAHYAARLRALPPGLTEWAVHPARDTPAARIADLGGHRVRSGDHAFLTSPAARALLRAEGVTPVDWHAIRAAWHRRG